MNPMIQLFTLFLILSLNSLAYSSECLTEDLQVNKAEITQSMAHELAEKWQSLTIRTTEINALWLRFELDQIVADEVEKAVVHVRENSGYWQRYLSGWGTQAGEKFAEEIANRVFSSPAVQQGLQRVIEAVVSELQQDMQKAMRESVDRVLRCFNQYAGRRFGDRVASVLQQQLQEKYEIFQSTMLAPEANASTRLLPAAGLALLLARRVVARMVALIAQRIGMRLATRWIPVLGWALFVGDFWWSADGVLPDIAHELRSTETRAILINNLTEALREELLNPEEVAEQLAVQLVQEWQQFRVHYQGLLSLAESSSDFQAALNAVPPNELHHFAQVTAQLRANFSAQQIIRWGISGDLRRLAQLPSEALVLLSEIKRIEAVFSWRQLIPRDNTFRLFVSTDIYRKFQPSQFESHGLNQLLELGDLKAINRVAELPVPDRDAILQLPSPYLAIIGPQLANQDWSTVAFYLRHLRNDSREQRFFLDIVRDYPQKLRTIDAPAQRQQIVQSANPLRAMAELTDLAIPATDNFALFGIDLTGFIPEITLNDGTLSALAFIVILLISLPVLTILFLWLLRTYVVILWRAVLSGIRAPTPKKLPSFNGLPTEITKKQWIVYGYDTFARERYVVGTFDNQREAKKAESQARRSVAKQDAELRDSFWTEELGANDET